MGSIVKTIGKVVKKAGKLLKKIAPVLLVAAAAYVGYGYMTGFQQGGWPQITEWGKSLMGGVSQGMPISEAANAAGGVVDGMGMPDMGQSALGEAETLVNAMGTPADALTRALPSESVTGEAIGEGVGQSTGGMIDGMGLPTEGGLLSKIEDTTNTRFTSLMDQFQTNVGPDSRGDVVNKSWTDWIMSPSQASQSMQTGVPWSGMGDAPGPFVSGHMGGAPAIVAQAGTDFFGGGDVAGGATFNAPTTVAQTAVPYGGANPYGWQSNQYADMHKPHTQDPGAMSKIAAMGKKAWGIYKGMWKDNPWMAMWTTQKVIETIAALLDDTAEKEAWRSRHVAGFEPGNWGDLRKKYKGNLPGGPKAGVWAGDNSRQSSIKTGPQIAGRIPTSTLDRKPQGLIGQNPQRALS